MAGAILLACVPWLIVSIPMVFGVPRVIFGVPRRGRDVWGPSFLDARLPQQLRALRPERRALAGLGVAAVLCVVAGVGGFVAGAAKGDARVLPGPRYGISSLDLNGAEWTQVSADEYAMWRARFVRESAAFFPLFGVALAGGGLILHRLGRQVRQSVDPGPAHRHVVAATQPRPPAPR